MKLASPAATHGATIRVAIAAFVLLSAIPAFAMVTCDLDGAPININNGASTAGKTGLVRCRDADTGLVQREQEVKNGVFMGAERFFEKGQLTKERRVNEKGNGDGPSKEWSVVDGKRVLVREETVRNGSTVGLARSWGRDGARQRLTWYGDAGREEASVEFNPDGKPSDLRCTTRPVFGSDFDDRTACGFAGAATTVLYDSKGRPKSRIAFEQGQRKKTEQLSPEGTVRDVREVTPTGIVQTSFYASGTKKKEARFTNLSKRADASPTAAPPTVQTLEQEYAESGRMVHERKWTPSDGAADLVEETTWYLNGQPKDETRIVAGPQGGIRREKSYYDTGTLASEADWLTARTRFSSDDHPIGTHRTFDERGRKRSELVYDDRGKLTRERTFDDSGAVTRDDEVYEDGSRKAVGR